MSSKGISKNADPKQKVPSSNIGKVEKMAMEGTLPRNKLQSGLEQASVSPANSNENQPSYRDEDDLGQMQQDGPVDENSPHQPDKAIRSIESNDIEMRDLGPSHAENNPLDVQSDHPPPEVSSPQSQDTAGLVEGFKCLAIIDTRGKKKANRPTESEPLDPNATVDGWGTLRGSTFVIVQEGPPHAARFTFRYEPNYTNDRFASTTDEDFRISAIRDRTASGKKVYRYTTANVAGIYGALFENTGSRTSTRSPCSWVKILWKDLRDDDKKRCKVALGFSWIPKCEFVRFCPGREAAEETIKQVWDNQENQYAAWAENQPGSGGRSRGTTPCPLNASLGRLRERRATSRLRTPGVRDSSPTYGTNSTPAPSRRDTRGGTRFNPVSLDEEPDDVVSPTSPEPRPTNTASSESDNRNIAETRGQAPTVKFSQADFMRKQAIKEGWGNLSPSDKEAREVVAEALYEIYKATMLQNNGEEVKGLIASEGVEEEL
ncbi:hypothetical protein N7478_010032 [Penicillium angulare]|uniref:uncharacterized protein n=1 Tax=Penicillium angulare TaxID=116970 RepID=UPI0025418DB4|nr:uncharacterized protein N7478_010032 [Penicillium angulare]KAJ5267224.1 hypothetical protein N7478_010032 [Penicillium angulare]